MKSIIKLTFLFLLIPLASAATLQGSIYDSNLNFGEDVLIEINTEPAQKYLAKEGSYTFELPPGEYTLTARNAFTQTSEKISIVKEGKFVLDLFLVPDFADEDELWTGTEEKLFEEEETSNFDTLRYVAIAIIFVIIIIRFLRTRKKYGPLRKFRKNVKEDHKKTIEQHKDDISQEPGYLEETIRIIKKHDGRISQKQLRKEMLHLSEAKISLILTELEHKNQIEKVKKGRGNVILLKP